MITFGTTSHAKSKIVPKITARFQGILPLHLVPVPSSFAIFLIQVAAKITAAIQQRFRSACGLYTLPPYNGYIDPYYWVDELTLSPKNKQGSINGSLDPDTFAKQPQLG